MVQVMVRRMLLTNKLFRQGKNMAFQLQLFVMDEYWQSKIGA